MYIYRMLLILRWKGNGVQLWIKLSSGKGEMSYKDVVVGKLQRTEVEDDDVARKREHASRGANRGKSGQSMMT